MKEVKVNAFEELAMDEMITVDGGIVSGGCVAGGLALMAVGYNARTGYTRTANRGGKTYSVTYKPTSGNRNFGTVCYTVGASLIGHGIGGRAGSAAGCGISLATGHYE